MIFKFEKLNDSAKLPTRAYENDSGMDLYASSNIIIPPRSVAGVPTGIRFQIGGRSIINFFNRILSRLFCIKIVIEAQIRPKSGLALKNWITVENTPGTIDMDYTGELIVIIKNDGELPYNINVGDKIAQLVFCPVIIPKNIIDGEIYQNTDRSHHGFGSTGIN